MSVLKKAIKDAKNIKELAEKKAQMKILEKLKPETQSLAKKLLEKDGLDEIPDEEMMGGEEEMPVDDLFGDEEMGGALSDMDQEVVDEIPQAVTDGEKLCTCANDGETITVNLDRLVDIAESEIKKMYEEEKRLLETLTGEIDEQEGESNGSLEGEELEEGDTVFSGTLDQITEMVTALTEEIVFNYKFQPTGHFGRPNNKELDEWEEVNKILQALEEKLNDSKEENKELREKYNLVLKKYRVLKEEIKQKISEANKEIKSAKRKIRENKEKNNSDSEKVRHLVLENAKLVKINEVLMNKKFNSKEKDRIVSVIQGSKTLNEVETNFNTAIKLVNSVEAVSLNGKSGNRRRRKTTLDEIKAAISAKGNIVESSSRLSESKRAEQRVRLRNMRLAGIKESDDE